MKRIFKGRVKKGREGGIRAGERGGRSEPRRGRGNACLGLQGRGKGQEGEDNFGDNFWESWDNNGDMKVGINGKYNIIT